MFINEILTLTIQNKASDLHLLPGIPPVVRIDGQLSYMTHYSELTREDIERMVYSLLTPEQKELLLSNKELDFSYDFSAIADKAFGRFRVNLYYQKGYVCGAFRFFPPMVRTIDDLHLPRIVHSFTQLRQGLVLVCGPTGQGKSTTLAAMINEINVSRAAHILTIEDPIEYVYINGKSIISQREMGIDTHSWSMALRSSLREDPDVIMVGDMRDRETMAAVVTIAEAGHLVFSALHTNSASQTIDRIIDSFPADQQGQIRVQLSSTLRGIISQRLIPQISGGRMPATEILIGTPAVASNIREAKTHLIDSIIQTSQDVGMMSLEASLTQLILSGAISLETAKKYTLHEEELIRRLK